MCCHIARDGQGVSRESVMTAVGEAACSGPGYGTVVGVGVGGNDSAWVTFFDAGAGVTVAYLVEANGSDGAADQVSAALTANGSHAVGRVLALAAITRQLADDGDGEGPS